ncbi:hypothetical protein FJY68_11610 [candidate division WOR-3 bacterium]|uniref:FlgD/Vpr Ig-like domain-containing protein n=1 Tax=candidate division WOR-3 bacterium TaxID=2052148 RepID=A0A938BUY2_UNCW3|nr:hypothetical protein [candidate division WOR-3 bacterium]
MRRALLVAVGLVAACSVARGEGGSAGEFLNYAIAPRSLGMGKAFTAIADDIQAGYFNPAGLYQLNAQEVMMGHSQLYGARLEYVGWALPTKAAGTFGFSLLNFGSEGIDARSPENQRMQSYFFMENALIASYAYNPWRFLGFGANLKLITKNIAVYSGVGVGADVSALILLPRPLSFGLVLQNLLQPAVRLRDSTDYYPRNLRAGAAVRLVNDRVRLAADLVVKDFASSSRRSLTPHGGIEFEVLPDLLIPRFGLDANEISVGLGVNKVWGKMAVGADYAFLLHYPSGYTLAPTHKIGVFLNFAGYRVWIDAQPALFRPTPEDRSNVLWMDVRLMARASSRRWQVVVKNQYGEVVRNFSGWDAPPARMTWDGLDDDGRLVADGSYSYSIVVVDVRNRPLSFSAPLTRIRTSGPTGKLEIRPQDR